MTRRCSRRTNMLPLDWDSYDRQGNGYDMVTNMIGNEEDLGEYDEHQRLALMRWHPKDLDKKGHKERYLIVSHPDTGWDTWEAWPQTSFKEACRMIKQYRSDLKEWIEAEHKSV